MKTAITTALLLAAATACTGPQAPTPTPAHTLPAITATNAPPAKPSTDAVTIQSGKKTKIEFIGSVFRIQYTLKNTTPDTSDFLITFEYRDKTGTRIGDGVDTVTALAPGQNAKATYDNYGHDGFNLTGVHTVRVTKVQSWPSR